MLSPPRNIVMVCSVVVFCAAVMGCSSSGDGTSADVTVEMPPEEMPTEEQPPEPPMPSEEDLGLIAAVHTMTRGQLVGQPTGETHLVIRCRNVVGRSSQIWRGISCRPVDKSRW